MSISIYTYSDPYKLFKEPFWEEVKKCPYFCASQTLVNGLKKLYKNDFIQGRVTTVQNLIETLYEDWESTACIIKQHTDIDNIISSKSFQSIENGVKENIIQTVRLNRDEVFSSLRIMFELNINVNDIIINKLTPEQTFIVELYKTIIDTNYINDFNLKNDFNESSIDKVLTSTMIKAREDMDYSWVQKDKVVIHGIHQFSPILLRAIEKIAEYKKVILLFNYQSQYKNAYQTWIDIYTEFDCPINDFGGKEFRPSLQFPISYRGNILADNIGKLINGEIENLTLNQSFEILEFDSMTEFAGYVACIFDEATKINPNNPMGKMKEIVYSADISVNNILKIYFPEQFGERQFLDYPLGHFFIAIANMWDPENNEIFISNTNDIKECLEAGILKEEYLGQLATIWGELSALFEGCNSIHGMLDRLNKLRKNQGYFMDQNRKEKISHISYYTVDMDKIDRLSQALSDLNKLAAYFYEDFEKHEHNFSNFYKRLRRYLQYDLEDSQSLGEEYADIIRRVLSRLEEVKDIDATASFECLKSTMSIYLVQEARPEKSANWIVRGFEQIEGDILRSLNEEKDGEPVLFHFACLSDEDINSVKKSEFPWPLTDAFFEVAQEPVDWKYQVYVKSCKEFKNFKRFALLYGLEFNRGKFKLSFVKRDGDKERDYYYLLKILGVKKHPYKRDNIEKFNGCPLEIIAEGNPENRYNKYDYYRFRICKYKFLLESLIEGNTVYKDTFLLLKYFEVLLENQVREDLQGFPKSEAIIYERLNSYFEEWKKYFPFVLNADRIDIINNVFRRLMNGKMNTFQLLDDEQHQYMMIRRLFLYRKLADPKTFRSDVMKDKFLPVTDDKANTDLSIKLSQKIVFNPDIDCWCQYCANRELCLAFYM